jgi:2-acylglycerol O-acyltransferase 2
MSSRVPLHAAPAEPEQRAKQNLPPKSYLDAVEQDFPAEDMDIISNTDGVTGKKGASVLKIVNTGAPAAESKIQERPEIGREGSTYEYSAQACLFQF